MFPSTVAILVPIYVTLLQGPADATADVTEVSPAGAKEAEAAEGKEEEAAKAKTKCACCVIQ